MRGVGKCFLLFLGLVGCAKGPVFSPPLPTVEPKGYFSYRTGPINGGTRIFLIAGGMTTASFAEEVIRQKRHWKATGLHDSQIACYYAIPSPRAFAMDFEQYRALAPELSECQPAFPGRIFSDIVRVLDKGIVDWIYVYATSHGNKPIVARELSASDVSLRNELERAPILGQHFLYTDVSPAWQSAFGTQNWRWVAEGWSETDLFFTPRGLKQALDRAPDVQKYVTLQGCYSGGFLTSQVPELARDGLAGLPNSSVLTSSSADRPSFGCQPGIEQTYFGHIYNEALKADPVWPPQVDWPALVQRVRSGVETLEAAVGGERSRPQFSSTILGR